MPKIRYTSVRILLMDAKYIEFYSSMMKKINSTVEEGFSKHEFFRDVCNFFDFANGFVYQMDSTSVLRKTVDYQVDEMEELDDEIDFLSELGPCLFTECNNTPILVYSEKDQEKPPLKVELARVLKAKAFVLVPIKNLHGSFSGLVGLSDRRKVNRRGNVDIENCLSVLTLLANIVKLEVYETGVKNAEHILSQVLDHTCIDIYVNDFYNHEILYVNKSMAAPYGGVKNMMGKKCWASIFDDKTGPCDFCPQLKLIDDEGKPTNTYSWDYQRPFDGSWFRVFSSAFPWVDGRLAHLVASVDITENKNNELLVQKLANCDALTGLANRRKLLKDLDLFIEDKTLFGKEWCMLFCDLDGFKEINDTLGHAAGDALLKEISVRLGKNTVVECKTYRNGGDEFVVLLSGAENYQNIFTSIKSIMKDFTDTCSFEGKSISCGCSIGAVKYPVDGKTSNELLHNADIAMYEAKNAGKGTVRYFNVGNACSEEVLIEQKKKEGVL